MCAHLLRLSDNIHNNNKYFESQNLVPSPRDYSKSIRSTYTRTQTHAHRHPQPFRLNKANYAQLKMGSKRPGDLERMKTSAQNKKHGGPT